jgi:hypothetical protein
MKTSPPSRLKRNFHSSALVGARNASKLVLAGLSASTPDSGSLPDPTPVHDYAAAKSFCAPQSAWSKTDGWKSYSDHHLDALMAEAPEGARDLRIAESCIRRADAPAQKSGANLLSSLMVNGPASKTRIFLNQIGPPNFKSLLPQCCLSEDKVTDDPDHEIDHFGEKVTD